jgi:hypothetical protein
MFNGQNAPFRNRKINPPFDQCGFWCPVVHCVGNNLPQRSRPRCQGPNRGPASPPVMQTRGRQGSTSRHGQFQQSLLDYDSWIREAAIPFPNSEHRIGEFYNIYLHARYEAAPAAAYILEVIPMLIVGRFTTAAMFLNDRWSSWRARTAGKRKLQGMFTGAAGIRETVPSPRIVRLGRRFLGWTEGCRTSQLRLHAANAVRCKRAVSCMPPSAVQVPRPITNGVRQLFG